MVCPQRLLGNNVEPLQRRAICRPLKMRSNSARLGGNSIGESDWFRVEYAGMVVIAGRKAVKRKWVISVASSAGSASTLHVITTDSLRKSLTQRVAARTDTVLAEAGGRYRTVVDRTLAGHLTLD